MRYVIRNKKTGEYFTGTGIDAATGLTRTSANISDAWDFRQNPDDNLASEPKWYKIDPTGWEVVPCQLVPVKP